MFPRLLSDACVVGAWGSFRPRDSCKGGGLEGTGVDDEARLGPLLPKWAALPRGTRDRGRSRPQPRRGRPRAPLPAPCSGFRRRVQVGSGLWGKREANFLSLAGCDEKNFAESFYLWCFWNFVKWRKGVKSVTLLWCLQTTIYPARF